MRDHRNCDLCGHDVATTIGEQCTARVPTLGGPVDFVVCLVCCQRCGLVFQHPPQEEAEIRAYYATKLREERCRPRAYIEEQFGPRVDFAGGFLRDSGKRLALEVGCADGTTLAGLRSRGFSVCGIEPSKENAEICRAKGIDIFNGVYQDFTEGPRRFDIVSSYYVLEHLQSPAAFLSFCNRVLTAEGILLLEIPDIGAYKREPTNADLLFFFEHQYHFTQSTIDLLLQRSGFRLLRFAERVTNRFGMLLGAQRVSAPVPPNQLTIADDAHDRVMALVVDYHQHFQGRSGAFEDRVLRLLRHNSAPQRIVLFGGGAYARQVLQIPGLDSRSIHCIVDNNPDKWGTLLEGVPIAPPTAIDESVHLVVVASSFHAEICDQLRGMGISPEKVVVL